MHSKVPGDGVCELAYCVGVRGVEASSTCRGLGWGSSLNVRESGVVKLPQRPGVWGCEAPSTSGGPGL